MSLGFVRGKQNERHLQPGSFNLGTANDNGQSPWPTLQKIHNNSFNVFSGAERKLYARCCSGIQGRVKTEPVRSQDVRTRRTQDHLSFYDWSRPGDPERPVTRSQSQVPHLPGQSSSHHIMVAFMDLELPLSASSLHREEGGGKKAICFSSYQQMLYLTVPFQIPPIKKGIRYKISLVWSLDRIPNRRFFPPLQ